MKARAIISKSSPWLERIIFLAVFLVLSFGTLVIVSTNNELNRIEADAKNYVLGPPPLKNEIRGLRCIHKENRRPIYAVSLGSLRAENNKLGIFKTGLHKVARIQDLELAFYRYAPPEAISSPKLNSENTTATITGDRGKCSLTTATDVYIAPQETFTAIEKLVGDIDNLINQKDGWRVNMDLSNVSEVRIANFDYKVFYDGALVLSVRSKRAMESNKRLEVVILGGHVVVNAADGSVLESNCVIWDTAKQQFAVDGTYFLTRNGKKMRGKGICVDDRLNIIQTQVARMEEQEERKWLKGL